MWCTFSSGAFLSIAVQALYDTHMSNIHSTSIHCSVVGYVGRPFPNLQFFPISYLLHCQKITQILLFSAIKSHQSCSLSLTYAFLRSEMWSMRAWVQDHVDTKQLVFMVATSCIQYSYSTMYSCCSASALVPGQQVHLARPVRLDCLVPSSGQGSECPWPTAWWSA